MKVTSADEGNVAVTGPPSDQPVDDVQQGAESGTVDQRRLARLMSLRARLAPLLANYAAAIAVFAVAYFIVGFYWAVGLAVIANIVIYVYTERIYVPPGYLVCVFGEENGTLVWRVYNIPKAIFECINKVGVSNSIDTRAGMAYLAERIEWDESGLPSHIEFAWIHYNTLNFVQKARLFGELRTVTERLISANNRYHWLMESMSLRKATEIARTNTDIISRAKRQPEVAAIDEIHLGEEVAKIEKELRDLQGLTAQVPLREEHVDSSGIVV